MTQQSSNTQFELFPIRSPKVVEADFPHFKLKDLTLSPENIIVLCIIFIMSWVLFFSFGVERGKHLAKATGEAASVVSLQQPAPAGQLSAPKNLNNVPAHNPVSVSKKGPAVKPRQAVNEPQGVKEQVISVPVPVEAPKIVEPVYTIQVASYKSQQTAQKAAKDIKSGNFEAFVLPKGEYVIVCVGKFGSMNEAKQLSNKLKVQYRDNLVRRL